MASFVMPCLFFASCGSDDNTGDGKQDVEKCKKCACGHDEGKCDNTCQCGITIVDAIDKSFSPSLSYLQKSWSGEYEGWDAVQEANTTIRRMLVLYPNGNYTNVIAGKLVKSGKDSFFKFESEAGTYTYDSSNRTVRYTCRYDSVLNYQDQSYTVYQKKHYYDHQEASYTEKADFSALLSNNKRRWITQDTYLQSLTDRELNIGFVMEEFNGDQQGQRPEGK